MRVTLALAQVCCRDADVAGNWEVLVARAREAADAGASVVVFPEYFLSGPRPTRDDVARAVECFADVPALARQAGIDIVAGTLGVVAEGGGRCNVCEYAASDGSVLARYAKRNPWKSETATQPGDCTVTVERHGIRFGFAICWDLTQPHLFTELATAGADVVLVPAYWARALSGPEVRHAADAEPRHIDSLCTARALENSMAIGFCNAAGAAHRDGAHAKVLAGRSQITLPFVGPLVRAEAGEECLLVGTLDTDILRDAEALYGMRAAHTGRGSAGAPEAATTLAPGLP